MRSSRRRRARPSIQPAKQTRMPSRRGLAAETATLHVIVDACTHLQYPTQHREGSFVVELGEVKCRVREDAPPAFRQLGFKGKQKKLINPSLPAMRRGSVVCTLFLCDVMMAMTGFRSDSCDRCWERRLHSPLSHCIVLAMCSVPCRHILHTNFRSVDEGRKQRVIDECGKNIYRATGESLRWDGVVHGSSASLSASVVVAVGSFVFFLGARIWSSKSENF